MIVNTAITHFYYAFYFILGAVCTAGINELFLFSLGREGIELNKSRIFSFLGKYIKPCAFCLNFWLCLGTYSAMYFTFGWEIASFVLFPFYAGLSHIVLKFVKSVY